MSDVITLIAKWLHDTVFPRRPVSDLTYISWCLVLVAFMVIVLIVGSNH
jgi:ABC-type bacteriocin/lantibiotic exporter with double-glycine peptidase domain